MAQSVEFRTLDSARSVRSDRRIRPFLAEQDDARTATVQLAEEAPSAVVEDVEGQAAETRAEQADMFGQVALTDRKREQIDFTRTDVPTARAAKGIAVGKGVDDFTAYFDPELTVDEHRDVFESAATEGGGQRGGRERMDQREVDRRIASGYQQQQREELSRAKQFAFEDADTDARAFVNQQGRRSEVFDISLSRTDSGALTGSGNDFARLQDRHESRSERAQTVDEKRQATVTRDPFQWYDDPQRYDYPGIDTVQPRKLHAGRSDHARAVDERERAPIADDKEQWARSPDQYDWPGVDTPSSSPDPGGWGGESAVLDTSGLGGQQGLGGGLVEQDTQVSFNVAADDSPDTRLAEEKATSFGVDDRSQVGRGVDVSGADFDDAGLEAFGGGAQKNKRLDEMFR